MVLKRKALAKSASIKKHKLITSNMLHFDMNMRFIKTYYVWNPATYGCETWVKNDTEKNYKP